MAWILQIQPSVKRFMEFYFLLSPDWRYHIPKTPSVGSSPLPEKSLFSEPVLGTLTKVLQSWLTSFLWKFIFLTFTSFLSSFLCDLKFHYPGAILTEYSAGQFRASFFVLFVHLALLGLHPFPSAQHAFMGCPAGAPEVLCFLHAAVTALDCPNKGRRACPVWIWEGNWCLPSLFPAPLLAGPDSRTRVHVLTSSQAWGLRFGSACCPPRAGHASSALSHV